MQTGSKGGEHRGRDWPGVGRTHTLGKKEKKECRWVSV